jgi:hypothetical protein
MDPFIVWPNQALEGNSRSKFKGGEVLVRHRVSKESLNVSLGYIHHHAHSPLKLAVMVQDDACPPGLRLCEWGYGGPMRVLPVWITSAALFGPLRCQGALWSGSLVAPTSSALKQVFDRIAEDNSVQLYPVVSPELDSRRICIPAAVTPTGVNRGPAPDVWIQTWKLLLGMFGGRKWGRASARGCLAFLYLPPPVF